MANSCLNKICNFTLLFLTMKSFLRLLSALSVAALFYSCERSDEVTNNPVAHFTYTSIGSFPVTVQFLNTSTSTGGTATYKWSFGDGTYAMTTNATHEYGFPGVYQVMLIQTLSGGGADSLIYALNLSIPQGPSGSSNRLEGPSTIDFIYSITSRAHIASFTNTSSDADSYLWKFGDGATSTTDSATVVHKYSTGGTYHVNLTASNSNGTDTCGATIVFQP